MNEEEQNLIDLVLNDMTSNLGVLIKAQRDKKKMSGRELARQSKVSSAVISDIECFKYIPKMEVILKLIFVLGISVKDLLNNIWTDKNERSYNFAVDSIKYNISTTEQKFHSPLQDVEKILMTCGFTATDIDEIIDYINYRKFMSKGRRKVPRNATNKSEFD